MIDPRISGSLRSSPVSVLCSLFRPHCFAILMLGVLCGSGSLATGFAADPPAESSPRRIYLDEFRPTPMLKGEEHLLTRAKFPCVNVHSHPGTLTRAEIDEMVRVMDETNIAVSVSLDGGTNGKSFADHYHELMNAYPDRFVVFLWIDYIGQGNKQDPRTWDVHQPGFGLRMADRLSDAVKQGASGLKVWKDLGLYMKDLDGKMIMPDDSRFDPIWARAGELHVPILWHCADPPAFFTETNAKNERWEELYRHPEWSFYGPEFPSHQELMAARNRVIARHPETTFICAHMAELSEDLKQLGADLDKYPNMNVEIAARISELGRQPYSSRKFFLRYADRILFGTDGIPPITELIPHFRFLETWDEYFPYEDNPFPPQGLWNIYGIGLPDDVLKKIYYENASRLIPGVAQKVKAYAEHHPQKTAAASSMSLFDGKTLTGWKILDDAGSGGAEVKQGSIVLKQGEPITTLVWRGTQLPRVDYELTMQARRVDGTDFFATVTFPVEKEYCSLILGGWGGGVVGLSSINGADASENETTDYRDFEQNRWYKIRIRVTKTEVQAWIDDKQIVNINHVDNSLSVRIEMERSKPLGLSSYYSTGEIRDLQLCPISAQPTIQEQSSP